MPPWLRQCPHWRLLKCARLQQCQDGVAVLLRELPPVNLREAAAVETICRRANHSALAGQSGIRARFLPVPKVEGNWLNLLEQFLLAPRQCADPVPKLLRLQNCALSGNRRTERRRASDLRSVWLLSIAIAS